MPQCRYSFFPFFLYVSYVLTPHAMADLQTKDDLRSNLQALDTLDNAHRDITSLSDTVTSLDNDLAEYQKRSCRFGLNSHHCALAELDNYMAGSDWLGSDYSPGKRSQPPVRSSQMSPEISHQYERILEDISKKRESLALLKSMLNDAGDDISVKRKRTCRFNLGGQCATELASAIADHYYYLNGPNSPGKRRRRKRRTAGSRTSLRIVVDPTTS